MEEKKIKTLRCPLSKKQLDLITIEEKQTGNHRWIKTGILLCSESKKWYPIINHVPVMLTFKTTLAAEFEKKHRHILKEYSDYTLPDLEPMPGEKNVQETFTEQWEGLGDDEITFIYTDDELLKIHRDVWLHLPEAGDPDVKTVLNVGCGFGRESSILANIFPNADIYAIELNLSLLKAVDTITENPRLHMVIASLFFLPFEPCTIDHVHTQGVIHHTYSTRKAFNSLAIFPREGGSMFVWVYAKEDPLVIPGIRGFLTRGYVFITNYIGRPTLSRLPTPVRKMIITVISLFMHPIYKLRSRHRRYWKIKNTTHSVRDIFTPRHAHRHGFNEVITWFEEQQFIPRIQSPLAYKNLMSKPLLGIGILGLKSDSKG